MPRLNISQALIPLAALFGLFFPSSIGGVISLALGQVALVLNAALLGLLLLGNGPLDRVQAAIATLMLAWLLALTLLAPQAQFASGAFFVFTGLACLLAVRLDRLAPHGAWLLTSINVFVLIVGLGLSLDIGAINAFVKTHYAAFYPGLLVSMIDWHHKPVLTLATHSTAGFFYYLFFWINFRTYRSTGSRAAFVWTLIVVALGINLRSTTSSVLMAAAVLQLAIYFAARIPRRTRDLTLVVCVPAAILAGILAGAPAHLAAVTGVLTGTESAGLRARYSSTGMLAGNLRYLAESPFSPIGFNYGPEDLFYGDSGFVLVLVRGSLPLLLLIYVGYGRFLYRNLASRTDARCLMLVTCAFEIGYVPLQLFRFTAFLPFVIAYLNNLPPEEPTSPHLRRLVRPEAPHPLEGASRPAADDATSS